MNNRGCVVLFGDFSSERLDVTAIGRDFGWSVAQASDELGLREISRSRTVVSVLIHVGSLGIHWREALRTILAAAPRARIIVCHKADQAGYKTEIIDAGAFGVLLSPLAHSEVRQSLGFVWASKITPLKHTPPAVAHRARSAYHLGVGEGTQLLGQGLP
jgi:DNA-binding NarL/FixJ family response regulator